MHTGVPHANRIAARNSDAYRRPVKVSNVRLSRASDGKIDIKFDVECSDMWRYAPDDGPGNFSAVWLFLKARVSTTQTGYTHDEIIDMLAPTSNLPRARAEAAKAQACKNLDMAFLRYGTGDAEAMFALGPASFSDEDEEELPQETDRVFINMQRTSIVNGGSPGTSAAQKDTLGVARYREHGEFRYDCKSVSNWFHGRLSSDVSEHSAPLGWDIVPTDTGDGLFLQPSADNIFAGPVTIKDVTVRWEARRKWEFPMRVWLHGLEMVYIPEGSYELGDPMGIDGPAGCFHARRPSGPPSSPVWSYKVESEDEIKVYPSSSEENPGHGLTWDNNGQFGTYGDVPASFPKGHKAYYMMRRQVTQGEYCDFMNAITGHAKTARFPYGGSGEYRYEIFKTEGGLRAATRPNRASNWMSWADAIAWCWWAGLRPMTEMEYEKACRGPLPAVPNEYAWGSTMLEQANVIVGSESSGAEYVTGNANLNNPYLILVGGDGGAGPCRDDGFGLPGTELIESLHRGGYATFGDCEANGEFHESDKGSIREATGMSYYGVFGLTGNLWEYSISAGHPIGRTFNPVHGDGELDSVGLPKYTDLPPERRPWPNPDCAGVSFRGGSWYTHEPRGRVSDRGFGSGLKDYNARSHDTGFRGVRTSPEYDEKD